MANESTLNSVSLNDIDDSINLESKVLLALSRLQYMKTHSKKRGRPKEFTCRKVVEFLKANYSWLDGDIQSQVKTVLLSLIKTGVVCIRNNAKYRLLVPNSKVMTSLCTTRITHGSHCCCFLTLKSVLRKSPKVCCMPKTFDDSSQKKHISAKNNNKKKVSVLSCVRNLRSSCKEKKTECALNRKDSSKETKKRSTRLKCVFDSKTLLKKRKKNCKICNSRRVSDLCYQIFLPRNKATQTF